MSWHSGTFGSAAAGTGLSAIWDAHVAGNGKWTLYDGAAAENEKVYRCYDASENVDFYVHVKDNNSGYFDLAMWAGWNAAGHAGVGWGISGNVYGGQFRCRRPNGGGWRLSVLNHRVIYIDTTNWAASYIGMPRRYDRSRNTPLIMAQSTSANMFTPTAYWQTSSTSVACRFLFDENGISPDVICDGGLNNSSYRMIMGADGKLRFPGELVVAGRHTQLAIGTLEGVVDLGAGTYLNFSPTAGETISIDGVDWLLFAGAYSAKCWSAVRMA